jgi:hypothetical protein
MRVASAYWDDFVDLSPLGGRCSDVAIPTKAPMSVTAWSKTAPGSSMTPTRRPNSSKLTNPKSCVHAVSARTTASSGTPGNVIDPTRDASALAGFESIIAEQLITGVLKRPDYLTGVSVDANPLTLGGLFAVASGVAVVHRSPPVSLAEAHQ